MSIQQLKDSLDPTALDTKLNIEMLFSETGSPGLSPTQFWSVALALAYASQNSLICETILNEGAPYLNESIIFAAKATATLMAMNNVYYRFLHMAENKEFTHLPARLRMNLIAKPGIARLDFELMSLAISSLAGCAQCLNAHIHEALKAGLSKEGIQSAVRLASVINSTKQALFVATQ